MTTVAALIVAGGPGMFCGATLSADKTVKIEQPCNCLGPQVVDGKLEPACPCAMRPMRIFESKRPSNDGKAPDWDV